MIVGNKKVGKTQLFNALLDRAFEESYESTAKDVHENLDVPSIAHFQFWDTSGGLPLRAMILGMDCVLILLDLTDASTFENVKRWMENVSDYPVNHVCIVACKADMHPRDVTYEQIRPANVRNFAYIETSSKTRENIDKLSEFMQKMFTQAKPPESSSPTVVLAGPPTEGDATKTPEKFVSAALSMGLNDVAEGDEDEDAVVVEKPASMQENLSTVDGSTAQRRPSASSKKVVPQQATTNDATKEQEAGAEQVDIAKILQDAVSVIVLLAKTLLQWLMVFLTWAGNKIQEQLETPKPPQE